LENKIKVCRTEQGYIYYSGLKTSIILVKNKQIIKKPHHVGVMRQKLFSTGNMDT